MKTKAKSKLKTKAQLLGKIGYLTKTIKAQNLEIFRVKKQMKIDFEEKLEKKERWLKQHFYNEIERLKKEAEIGKQHSFENVSLASQVEYLKGRLGELPSFDQAIFDAQQTPLEFTVTH